MKQSSIEFMNDMKTKRKRVLRFIFDVVTFLPISLSRFVKCNGVSKGFFSIRS